MAKDGHGLSWADVIQNLGRLQMVQVEQDGRRFLLRSEVQGTRGPVFRSPGVAVPPTVQQATQDPADPYPVLGAALLHYIDTYIEYTGLRLYTVSNQSRSWLYMGRNEL
jgi:hypothetical protein